MTRAGASRRALVTGANGIVGLNVLTELATREAWEVVAIGRRDKAPMSGVTYRQADLTDPASTRAAITAGDFTHLFFAAFQHAVDPYEECAVNLAMLRNTLAALRSVGAPLQRVIICEGAKAYGALMGPMRTPAKESDPRVPGPLYYFDLEDELFAAGRRDGFTSTILRPDYIAGIGFGSYTNLLSIVAIYATVCKAVGLPLCFPGGARAYEHLFQITDARLLGRGMIWAAERDTSVDEIFNITNGDLVRWSHLWPRIARYFELELGQVLNFDLELFMRDKGAIWTGLAERHGLTMHFEAMVNWAFSGILNVPCEIHSSTIRIRQAGFHECLDTEERLQTLFDEMRSRKLIP